MLKVRPVTSDRWEELAALFGSSGAFSHCWCTWWRQTAADFSHGIEEQGAGNRALMHEIVEAGNEPGLLAYRDGRPVGWVSVAPYPVDTSGGRHPAANLFTGTLAMFKRAGFREVDRPRGAQLVVRRDL
jgi:hypothetical protein